MTTLVKKNTSLIRERKKRVNFFQDIIKNKVCYLLALPALLYTFIFGYMTLPYMLIAFQRYRFDTGLFGSEWVGLRNFEFFFRSATFVNVTMNTLRINFFTIICTAFLAVCISIMISEVKHKLFARTNQSVLLFPHFISWMLVSYIVYALFATRIGVINNALSAVGLQPVNWYASPEPWRYILVGLRVWKLLGIQTVIYLAAITGIGGEYNEAAMIDGASRFQRIIYITVPLLIPTVSIMTLLALGRVFHGDFAMIYSIIRDNGMLFPTTDVIDTFVFRALRRTGDPSAAMAVGLYQSVMGFIMVFGSNLFARKFTDNGALF